MNQADLVALWMIDERRAGWRQYVVPDPTVMVLMLAYERVSCDPQRDSDSALWHRGQLILRHAISAVRSLSATN